MTERTVKTVSDEIVQIQNEMQEAAQLVVGDSYNPAVVNFRIVEVADPYDMPLDEWKEAYAKFDNGETIGDLEVVVHTTHGAAEISSEDFTRITVAKMALTGLLIILADLRKERAQLKEIEQAERELELMKEGIA